MQLEGLHHVTAITADAPRNVDFYAGLLGLRFVKKTVNYDAPDVYHLYFGDEGARPGSILTFFEFPGAARGRPGAGAVHRLLWRVGSGDALDFWAHRLDGAGVAAERSPSGLRFADPEGLAHELVVEEPDEPLVAVAAGVSPELALQGFHGARAYARSPQESGPLNEALGFRPDGDHAWVVEGEERRAVYGYDPPPAQPDRQGAGSVHHVAWASRDADHAGWRERALAGGARPTPIIDRTYFRSIYFREPSGVLFEIATLSPGFAVDEDAEHLGESLVLPAHLEARRAELERALTPVENPRT